jgi:hypothetical protein
VGNRDCAPGGTCLLSDASGTGVCSLEVDLGCESGVGRTCASGLVCVADRCAQACDATLGCATGSICTPTGAGVSFCAPASADAAVPVDVGVDGGDAGPAPCGAIVDLRTADAGASVVARVDTSSAPAVGVLPLLPCASGAATHIGHQVAFAYRMRRGGFVRVDSRRPATAPNFDTVVGIFRTCEAAPSTLACVDDYQGDLRARAVSDVALSQGDDVIIGVGGVEPPSAGNIGFGTVEIAVDEVAAVLPPGSCDVHGLTSLCAGSACATVQTAVGRCVVTTDEVEPNPRSSPQRLPVGAGLYAARGGLDTGDEDCFALDVPAGGSVVLVPTDGRGDCPRDAFGVTTTLLDSTGMMVDQAVGATGTVACPAIDGTSAGAAHGLAAGTYTACIAATDGFVLDAYDLSVSVLP